MFEQEEQRDELLEKIEDLISRKRYAELRDLLLPLEAQDIAGLFMELDDKVPMVFRLLPKAACSLGSRRPRCSWSWILRSRRCSSRAFPTRS